MCFLQNSQKQNGIMAMAVFYFTVLFIGFGDKQHRVMASVSVSIIRVVT